MEKELHELILLNPSGDKLLSVYSQTIPRKGEHIRLHHNRSHWTGHKVVQVIHNTYTNGYINNHRKIGVKVVIGNHKILKGL